MVTIKKNFFDDVSLFMMNQFTIKETIEDFIISVQITKKMNPNLINRKKNKDLKSQNHFFTKKNRQDN